MDEEIKRRFDEIELQLYEIKNPPKFKEGDKVIALFHLTKKLHKAIYECRLVEREDKYTYLEKHYVQLLDKNGKHINVGEGGHPTSMEVYYVFPLNELENV